MKRWLTAFVVMFASVAVCRGDLQLPEPPQQHQPWHPDAAIPAGILSAADTLFQQGFPDPRGCEYREIEVECGVVFATNEWPVKTRGWVLPAIASETNRFAICWNGLIYPVVAMGAEASLSAEASHTGLTGGVRGGVLEPRAVVFSDAPLARSLLLLRSGEIATGLQDWRTVEQAGNRGQNLSRAATDAYVRWAGAWDWGLLSRALCAHVRGDEVLALATTRQLADLQPKIEAECARRGFAQRPEPGPTAVPRPYFGFLEQLPQLQADLERRGKEKPYASTLQVGVDHYPNQSERIACLIRDLELIAPPPAEKLGETNLALDATVAALIREGEAAVDPLLDCLEHDKRLTRRANYAPNDTFPGRTIVPVSTAAVTAIQAILHVRFDGGLPEMRAYWNTYRSLKLEDRWYAVLRDDTARSRWLEAAGQIIEPGGLTTVPHARTGAGLPALNKPERMPGEILRTKSDPSISELMAKRALDFSKGDSDPYDLAAACQMGLCLAVWDAPSAGPVVQTLSKHCRTAMEDPSQKLGSFLTKLAIARAWAADPNAFEDYAEWLSTTTPDQLSFPAPLEPLTEYPTNSVLQSAAEKIFDASNSQWSGLSLSRWPDDLASSQLARVPAIRRYLVRELDRKEVIGSAHWEGGLHYSISNGTGSMSYELPVAEQPAMGAKAQLRSCDWLAVLLSINGTIPRPRYNPFPPDAQRDAALETIKDYLRK
jgi:hypothetical protein